MKESAFLNQLRSRLKINRNSEWFIFFWCVMIASVYWFLKAMNERYTSSLEMQVEYINVPADKTFTHPLPDKLQLRVNAQGWDLFGYSLRRKLSLFSLDIGDIGNVPYVVPMNESEMLVQQLPSNIEILDISPDTIPVQMEPLGQKTVPVLLMTDSIYPKQYGLSGNITVEPDSIIVSGPRSVVKEVEYVPTIMVTLENMKRSNTQLVALEKFKDVNIKYSFDKVRVSVPIEKLTEGKVEVPVKIINIKSTDTISLIPQRTTITFQTAISNYSNIYPGLFEATVDAANIDSSSQNQLKISVTNKPPFTFNLWLQPEYVDFVRQTK